VFGARRLKMTTRERERERKRVLRASRLKLKKET